MVVKELVAGLPGNRLNSANYLYLSSYCCLCIE